MIWDETKPYLYNAMYYYLRYSKDTNVFGLIPLNYKKFGNIFNVSDVEAQNIISQLERDKKIMIEKDKILMLDCINIYTFKKKTAKQELDKIKDVYKNIYAYCCKYIEEPALWKTSYDVYKRELEEAFSKLISNPQKMAELERIKMYPEINVFGTLNKAYTFWRSINGWKRKKRQRIKKIDWEQTFKTALNLKFNWIFNTKLNNYNNETNEAKGYDPL